MREEQIRAFNGQIIGIIEHHDNGDKVARNWPARQIVGYYKKATDSTTDVYGRVLTRGDTVITLLDRKY